VPSTWRRSALQAADTWVAGGGGRHNGRWLAASCDVLCFTAAGGVRTAAARAAAGEHSRQAGKQAPIKPASSKRRVTQPNLKAHLLGAQHGGFAGLEQQAVDDDQHEDAAEAEPACVPKKHRGGVQLACFGWLHSLDAARDACACCAAVTMPL
jgi:hypothetical protein